MAKCKLLAFLLCDRATRDPDGKVTLHGIFDRIIIPRSAAHPKLLYVFYKIVVEQPCAVTLRVIDPFNGEIPGNWRDSIGQLGPVQSIWALTTTLFKRSGPHALELRLQTDDSEALLLTTMLFVVEHQGE
jgi:hypothetical protein